MLKNESQIKKRKENECILVMLSVSPFEADAPPADLSRPLASLMQYPFPRSDGSWTHLEKKL